MKALIALTLALTAITARAELYGALGYARVDSDLPALAVPGVVDQGATATGNASGSDSLPIAFGWRFNRWLAAEGSFLQAKPIHETNNSVRATSDPLSRGNATREWSFWSIGLAAVGTFHVFGDFAVLAKGALNYVDAEFKSSTLVTRTDLVPPQTLVNQSVSARSKEWIPSYGLGIGYVGKPIGARLVYERFADKSGLYGAGNDLDGMYSLSLQATFFF